MFSGNVLEKKIENKKYLHGGYRFVYALWKTIFNLSQMAKKWWNLLKRRKNSYLFQ